MKRLICGAAIRAADARRRRSRARSASGAPKSGAGTEWRSFEKLYGARCDLLGYDALKTPIEWQRGERQSPSPFHDERKQLMKLGGARRIV